jgi:polyisoprenoid-binding protein YceI
MKKLFAAALFVGLSGAVFAADTYTIDSNHAWPTFEINHFGLSTQRGRFDKTAGTITLDKATKTGAVEATIQTDSISLGFQKWDDHLKSEDFFDAAKYPTITFKSDKFSFDGDALVTVDGQLTMHGVTKPVKLTIANFKCVPHPMLKREVCAADISTTIDRTQWGITKYAPNLGSEVLIKIPVEAIKNS